MIAAKHFDPVLGVDIHIIQPPGPVPPVPIPHPFVGMLIDPSEYVPIIGGTVKVNGMMRGVAGTGGKAIPPHIPIGGVFVVPPGNECEMFMGSATVAVDGDPQSRLGDPVLSCHSVGMPSIPRLKIHAKPKTLMLPTSVVLAVPMGPPVLVGGPPTISLSGMAMKFGMAALGKVMKKLRKLQKASKKWKAISDKMRNAVNKLLDKVPGGPKLKGKASNAICSLTGHPVDVASGKVTTEATDVTLPGPLPFTFSRVWYSQSTYAGPLGHGWHHSYDLGLYRFPEGIVVRLADGRFVVFAPPVPGEPSFDRTEKLFLHLTDRGYHVQTLDGLAYHFGWPAKDGSELPLDHVRDPNDNRIVLERDRGRLVAFVDSGGRRLPVTTDAAGRITEIHVPDPDKPGETFPMVSFRYDRRGDLVQADDALGNPFRYEYLDHLLVRETDRSGLAFYFMYDGSGPDAKCLRTWGDDNLYLRDLSYDPARQRTEVTNSLGHKTVYEWNAAGLVVKQTDPLGGSTLTEWSPHNDKLSVTNPNGEATQYAYDEFGREVSITDPAGNQGVIEYDVNGRPASFTNGAGAKWVWERDERGNATALIDPLGGRTTYRLHRGLWAAVVGADGGETRYEYDGPGNLTRVIYPDGTERSWELDVLGWQVAAKDPLGNVVRVRYDRRGDTRQATNPTGIARNVEYDRGGHPVRVTAGHREGELQFGPLHTLTSHRAGGREWRITYDTEQQVVEETSPRGDRLRYEYDAAGRKIAEHDYDGAVTRYEYNPAGRLVRRVRPSGRATRYEYDGTGRMTRVWHDGQPPLTMKYRGDGQLMEAASGGRVVRFDRDPLGRVLREYQDGHWVAGTFDPAGFRTAVASSLGLQRRDSRDPLGNLTGVRVGDWSVRIARNAVGGETIRTFASGSGARWERDQVGRPTALHTTGAEGWSVGYEWDGGRIASLADSRTGVTAYDYDPAGFAVRERGPDGVLNRTVDVGGNVYRDESRRDRVYGPGGRLDAAEGTTYRYDPDGNLTEAVRPDGTAFRYEWSADGRLRGVTRPDGRIVRFEYDPVGRRVAKHSGGRTTRWVWDGPTVLHEWEEKDGRPVGEPVSWVNNRSSGQVYGKKAGGEWFDAVDDHRGAVVRLTDARGREVWNARYDLYGDPRTTTGGPAACPFRFPGQYEDVETGLYYNHFRYYSPGAGQYISKDPMGRHGGDRPYGYVHDPLTWIDPAGLTPTGPASTNPLATPGTTTPAGMQQAGNSGGATAVRPGVDIHPDPNTNIIPAQQCDPANGIWPDGKSATVDPSLPGPTGVFHGTPEGTPLPEGLAAVRDGAEVGGPRDAGHVTIYNTRDMTPEEFEAKRAEIPTEKTVKVENHKTKGRIVKQCAK